MNLTLTPRQRALLLFLSASGFIAWFSGLGDRIEAQGLGGAPRSVFTMPPRAFAPQVTAMIVRDPFAAPPSVREIREGESPSSASRPDAAPPFNAAVPRVAARDSAGAGDPLVPNIDGNASERVPAATQTLSVRATLVGPNPVAYVANGEMLDIVRVGDTLADRRIVKIDLHGLIFNDGTRLDLPESFLATPPPAPKRGAITLSVEDLRRLLAPRNPPPSAVTHAPAMAAAIPQPSPTATYPSPGPLPSVNADGLPVGVNPTSNPANPTPYPYPYPYAPAGR